MSALLEVCGLRTHFHAEGGDFTVEDGRTLADVRESGCGKSLTVLSIMGQYYRNGPAAPIRDARMQPFGRKHFEAEGRQQAGKTTVANPDLLDGLGKGHGLRGYAVMLILRMPAVGRATQDGDGPVRVGSRRSRLSTPVV